MDSSTLQGTSPYPTWGKSSSQPPFWSNMLVSKWVTNFTNGSIGCRNRMMHPWIPRPISMIFTAQNIFPVSFFFQKAKLVFTNESRGLGWGMNPKAKFYQIIYLSTKESRGLGICLFLGVPKIRAPLIHGTGILFFNGRACGDSGPKKRRFSQPKPPPKKEVFPQPSSEKIGETEAFL